MIFEHAPMLISPAFFGRISLDVSAVQFPRGPQDVVFPQERSWSGPHGVAQPPAPRPPAAAAPSQVHLCFQAVHEPYDAPPPGWRGPAAAAFDRDRDREQTSCADLGC